MIVEGVNFVDSVCLAMSEDEFVAKHLVFFKDLKESDRKKKLRRIYAKMKDKF